MIKKLDTFVAVFLIYLIKIYQKTLSLDHGPLRHVFPGGYCKFHPSCSQYGIDALNKYGFFKGIPKVFSRVGRCNPWNDGGVDEA